jgi:ribosomal 30S subunit maturation factor RimM
MALDPTANEAPAGYVRLGRLGRTFQLEGALRLQLDEAVSYDGPAGAAPVAVRAIRAAQQLFVTGLGDSRVRRLQDGGGGLLLLLEGARDRTAAQRLVNATVWVDPLRLPADLAQELAAEVEAGSDEERLVGLPVLLNGQRVGQVSGARLNPMNPVLEAELDGGGPAALLPLQAPYVNLTDRGVELLDPPAGWLERD